MFFFSRHEVMRELQSVCFLHVAWPRREDGEPRELLRYRSLRYAGSRYRGRYRRRENKVCRFSPAQAMLFANTRHAQRAAEQIWPLCYGTEGYEATPLFRGRRRRARFRRRRQVPIGQVAACRICRHNEGVIIRRAPRERRYVGEMRKSLSPTNIVGHMFAVSPGGATLQVSVRQMRLPQARPPVE